MLRSERLEYALVALSSVATLGAGGERPIRGGILPVALRAEPKTFNPVVSINAPSRDVLRRIHADLIGIGFRLIADEEMHLARFVSGQPDVLNRPGMKSISCLQGKGAAIADPGPGLEYNFLCFNLTSRGPKPSWLGWREFRAALSAATDRETMARSVTQARGQLRRAEFHHFTLWNAGELSLRRRGTEAQ